MKITIRDSGCFIGLKEGLWQKIGQKGGKHAELMLKLDKAMLPAHGFLVESLEDCCLKLVFKEIDRVCQLFWDLPELVSVLRQNREGRRLRKKIEPYPMNMDEARKINNHPFPNVQSLLSYAIKAEDYEIYCALLTRTGGNKDPLDWFPVWIAACICELENKINTQLNNGTDLIELEASQHNIIEKICAPLGELFDFELREIKRIEMLMSTSQKGGQSSKRQSVMASAIDSVKADEPLLKYLNHAKSKPRCLAGKLKERGLVTRYEEGKGGYITFNYKGKEDEFAWESYKNSVSKIFRKL